MTKVEIALSYLEKGFSVIPLYGPEMIKKPSPAIKKEYQKKLAENKALKEPVEEKEVLQKFITQKCKQPFISWKKYQNQLPTRKEVTDWFTNNPAANIGIITGAVSNLVVFDLDSSAAVHFAEEMGGFPDTAKVKTGRGYHLYMKHPGFEIKNDVNKNLKLDIRADGGQVVAPPSIHGSGHQYEWVQGASIFDIEPAECSQWMIDYLKDVADDFHPSSGLEKTIKDTPRPDESKADIPSRAVTVETKTLKNKKRDYLDILTNGCVDGERNNSATIYVGHLFAMGMKESEIWEIFKLWNKEKVKPPLGEDDLMKIFNSIKKNEEEKKLAIKTIDIDSFLDNIEKTVIEYENHYVRIPFANHNLVKLESVMNGGLLGGAFYLLGGIPSAGKTVLLNNISDNICLNGFPVLFFSYDDEKIELRHRTFSRFSGQSIEDFNKRIPKDMRSIGNLPEIQQILNLKYVVEQMIPVEKWCDVIEQIKKKHGQAPVIVIDYLRKLRAEKSTFDERLRIDDILGTLTQIAKTNNMPVIAISELGRDSYKSGQRLSMASFKESGHLEYEASWLGILAAVEEKDGAYIIKENWDTIIQHDGNVDLIIFKAKRGTGTTERIPLKVDINTMIVRDRKDVNLVTRNSNSSKKTKF
jgi:replicative DNA helicase